MSNLRKTDSPQDILEPRIAAQSVEHGINAKKDQMRIVLRVSALQPGDGLVDAVQTRMKCRHPVRKDVAGLVLFDFLEFQSFLPIACDAAATVRAAEILEDWLRIPGEFSPPLIRRECLGIAAGCGVRICDAFARLDIIRINLQIFLELADRCIVVSREVEHERHFAVRHLAHGTQI